MIGERHEPQGATTGTEESALGITSRIASKPFAILDRIGTLLEQILPNGHVVTECPVSTPDGVKAIDVAWLTPERGQEADTETCLTRAPVICIEILSPSNTAGEIRENIALYFEAGACEVWICVRDGTLKFHFSSPARDSRIVQTLTAVSATHHLHERKLEHKLGSPCSNPECALLASPQNPAQFSSSLLFPS
jgi:hypothetical protein